MCQGSENLSAIFGALLNNVPYSRAGQDEELASTHPDLDTRKREDMFASNRHLLISLQSSPKDVVTDFRERETSTQERNIDQLPPVCALTGDRTHNLGMCPDLGLPLQPFGAWDNAAEFFYRQQ